MWGWWLLQLIFFFKWVLFSYFFSDSLGFSFWELLCLDLGNHVLILNFLIIHFSYNCQCKQFILKLLACMMVETLGSTRINLLLSSTRKTLPILMQSFPKNRWSKQKYWYANSNINIGWRIWLLQEVRSKKPSLMHV